MELHKPTSQQQIKLNSEPLNIPELAKVIKISLATLLAAISFGIANTSPASATGSNQEPIFQPQNIYNLGKGPLPPPGDNYPFAVPEDIQPGQQNQIPDTIPKSQEPPSKGGTPFIPTVPTPDYR